MLNTRQEVEDEIHRASLYTKFGTIPAGSYDRAIRLLDIAQSSGLGLPYDVLIYDPESSPPGIGLEWRGDPFLIVTAYAGEDGTLYDWQVGVTVETLEEAQLIEHMKGWRA